MPAVLILVVDPFLADLLPVELILHLVSGFEVGVEVLPHISDDLGHLGDSALGVLSFDGLVDVHAVQEESAEGLLGRLGRDVVIVKLSHFTVDHRTMRIILDVYL